MAGEIPMMDSAPAGKAVELVRKLKEKHQALSNIRMPWTTLWSELAAYIQPRRAYSLGGTLSPSTDKESRLFDTTAVQANQTLAAGCVAWMSPLESQWFSFDSSPGRKPDEDGKRWLSECTTICRSVLATSNFYVNAHECYLDRGGYGTTALYIEPGRKSKLNVECWPVGTFCIDTDDEGNVDTVIREITLTPRQACQKFGEENLSPKTCAAYKAGGDKAQQPIKFVHCIYPREDSEREQGKIDDVNMPIASVYYEEDSGHCCRNSGYEEMPVMVTRYLEWGSGYGHVYGWAPAFAALPEARQLNFMQKMMDALAEKMAFPPMLAPEEMEGELDPNANGVTYFSRELAAVLPRPLQEGNRYDIGLERIKERQEAIKRAFHVDLFSMFSEIEKQMTAREVMERSSEKLIQFSPTFARLTTEFFNPALKRVFNIGLRAGWFPQPPPSMITPIDAHRGIVEDPEIQYSSRIALALRALPSLAYHRTLERILPMAQAVPAVLDIYDFDAAERETSMNDGVPPTFIRKAKQVEDIRSARAAAQQQQMQMEQAAAAAKAAGDVGRIPAESPVGQAIGNSLPNAA